MARPLVADSKSHLKSGFIVAGLGAVLGLLLGGIGGAACFTFFGLMSLLVMLAGHHNRDRDLAAPFLQESTKLLTRGDFDGAEHAVGSVPATAAKKLHVARLVRLQRALIALMRGDAEQAETLATRSIAATKYMPDAARRRHFAEALAIRALARAARGEGGTVEEDVRAVEDNPMAGPAATARAQLARAVMLARMNDRASLSHYLGRFGTTILADLLPRERSLLRALRTLAGAPEGSVYRELVRPDALPSEDARVGAWIRHIAPNAAAFAPHEAIADVAFPRLAAEPDAVSGMRPAPGLAPAPGLVPAPKRNLETPGLVITLLLAPPVLWFVMRDRPFAPKLPFSVDALAFVLPVLFFVVLVPLVTVKGNRLQRTLTEAARHVASGNDRAVIADLRRLSLERAHPRVAAGALEQLAALGNRHGRFLDAVNDANAGLVLCLRIGANKRGDLTTPNLRSERALALAAMDQFAEAEAELAQLTHHHPDYPLLAQAAFRLHLVTASRRGDRALAAQLALSRSPDLPLDLKTDLLADAVLAETDASMPPEERARIAAELRAMPDLNAWVTWMAAPLQPAEG